MNGWPDIVAALNNKGEEIGGENGVIIEWAAAHIEQLREEIKILAEKSEVFYAMALKLYAVYVLPDEEWINPERTLKMFATRYKDESEQLQKGEHFTQRKGLL